MNHTGETEDTYPSFDPTKLLERAEISVQQDPVTQYHPIAFSQSHLAHHP